MMSEREIGNVQGSFFFAGIYQKVEGQKHQTSNYEAMNHEFWQILNNILPGSSYHQTINLVFPIIATNFSQFKQLKNFF